MIVWLRWVRFNEADGFDLLMMSITCSTWYSFAIFLSPRNLRPRRSHLRVLTPPPEAPELARDDGPATRRLVLVSHRDKNALAIREHHLPHARAQDLIDVPG
jgi:hypothetical protein